MNKLILIGLFAAFSACGNASQSNNAAGKIINADYNVSAAIPVPTPPHAVEPEIKKNWHQRNNNLTFDWDGDDLSVIITGEKVSHIFEKISKARARRMSLDIQNDDCDVSHSFQLTSVVGTVVSFVQDEAMFCGMTSIDWRYTTIDLNDLRGFDLQSFSELENKKFNPRNTTPLVSLTTWFSEDEILKALLANQDIASAIEQAIRGGKLDQFPVSLSEFRKIASEIECRTYNDPSLREDFLTRFTFHHIDGENIVVWISLTPTSHASQAVQDHLAISLPIPERLRSDLLHAANKTSGFLMTDALSEVGNTSAEFEYAR